MALDALNAQISAALKERSESERTRNLIRGTLLLWHDHLDAAHSIAQEIEDSDGSLLHAMMHRRELDYWNSKYWFRRAGRHACYPAIAGNVRPFLINEHAPLADQLTPRGVWEPAAFVDACEMAAGRKAGETNQQVLQKVQRFEFLSFLEHLCA